MKKLLFLLYIIAIPAFAIEFPEKPNPPRLVNDFAGLLSANEDRQLENKLVAFNDSTSIQIAVITITTLDGYDISDYAFKLAQQWGIGQKGSSNGVLLLISKEERKMFIATGYGMEGIMPDVICSRIIRDDITPDFKRQQYFEGIDKGTTQMMLLAKGEYKGTGSKKGQKEFPLIGFGVVFLVIFLVIVSRVRSTRSYALLNNVPFWVAWQLLNAAASRQKGQWNDFNRGGGFFGGGGFGGGGSSGGGGFGGFGGGSFGGGGAGGSW